VGSITDELEPKLRASGSRIPSQEEVSKQIDSLLVDSKVSRMMDDWIQTCASIPK